MKKTNRLLDTNFITNSGNKAISSDHTQRENIKYLEKEISIASSTEELDYLLEMIDEKKIKLDGVSIFFPIFLALLSISGSVYGAHTLGASDIELWIFTFGIGFILFSLIYAYRHFVYLAPITVISETFYNKYTALKAGFRPIPIKPSSHAASMASYFKEFSRGSLQAFSEIDQWLEGHYQGTEHNFDYIYYRFKFERYTTTSQKLETRYGLIVNVPFTPNLQISNKKYETLSDNFKTSSLSFHKHCSIHTDNVHQSQKFLSPVMLQEIERNIPLFSDMAIEFNHLGQLCLSFTNHDVFLIKCLGTLVNISDFRFGLHQKQNTEKLMLLLEFIHTMLKYSDNNFEKSITSNKQ